MREIETERERQRESQVFSLRKSLINGNGEVVAGRRVFPCLSHCFIQLLPSLADQTGLVIMLLSPEPWSRVCTLSECEIHTDI